MSSPMTRPAIAWWAFAVAGAAWVGLIVSIGMMLAADGKFVGNPIFTFFGLVAVSATGAGIQLRCHTYQVRLAGTVAIFGTDRTTPMPEVTREIIRPPALYRATARVIDPAAITLGREVTRRLQAVEAPDDY